MGAINEIPLTPLIDTALTLLIIFMLTTPMMDSSIKLNLPSAHQSSSEQERQELIVSINKEGKIIIDDTPCSADQLQDKLGQLIKNNEKKTVFVRADQGVQYGQVVQVVDQLKMLEGVQYVALATQG